MSEGMQNFLIFVVIALAVIGSITCFYHLKKIVMQVLAKIDLAIDAYKTKKIRVQIDEIEREIKNLNQKMLVDEESLEQVKPYNFILKRFAAIDVETTGLKAANCNIIQFSVVLFINGIPEHMYCKYINPGIPLPANATKVNGITNEMVKDAPRFEQLAEFISRIVTREKIVAHNLRFDASFIERELSKTQYAAQINWGLCTMALDLERPHDLKSKPNRFIKLSELAKRHEIEIKGQLHDAYTDALVAGKIAVCIAKENSNFERELINSISLKKQKIMELTSLKIMLEQKMV